MHKGSYKLFSRSLVVYSFIHKIYLSRIITPTMSLWRHIIIVELPLGLIKKVNLATKIVVQVHETKLRLLSGATIINDLIYFSDNKVSLISYIRSYPYCLTNVFNLLYEGIDVLWSCPNRQQNVAYPGQLSVRATRKKNSVRLS